MNNTAKQTLASIIVNGSVVTRGRWFWSRKVNASVIATLCAMGYLAESPMPRGAIYTVTESGYASLA